MKKKNFHLSVKRKDFTECYYLNNQLLFKTLLSHDAHMNIQREIVVNNNCDNLGMINEPTVDGNELLFFNLNEKPVNNPNQIIKSICCTVNNEICIINEGLDIINVLDRIIK
ncbi:hypothetical protein [Candidatus Enterococcus ikei]|uniref:Uncharacterized protein n=1 Tax=Candidatus Enterococcus ikei TaxID=2815326 RepID=A0ABS3GVV9_9ENTE|nr:hypothetical protein [Enterococcus sp. DIV0869a]MBO0439395.1 hypothetical protein [Enterococcus sp. DIV0869a]